VSRDLFLYFEANHISNGELARRSDWHWQALVQARVKIDIGLVAMEDQQEIACCLLNGIYTNDLEGHVCCSFLTSGNIARTINYTWFRKRMWLGMSTVLSKLKDFSRSQPVTYTIHVVISRKWCDIDSHTLLLLYRALTGSDISNEGNLMTLGNMQGH